jgi:hypothetical protein
MRKEHGDDVVNQSDPPISAGIVGNLLINKTGHQRGPQIHMSWVSDAGALEPLPGAVESADSRGVRLRGGTETWNQMLEQQLVPGHVRGTEGREAAGMGHQLLVRSSAFDGLGIAALEAFGSLAEHSVEDGVL